MAAAPRARTEELPVLPERAQRVEGPERAPSPALPEQSAPLPLSPSERSESRGPERASETDSEETHAHAPRRGEPCSSRHSEKRVMRTNPARSAPSTAPKCFAA